MVRSRLLVPSLLRFLGALLMLFPELLMGNDDDFYEVPITDPGVQEALACAVEIYNQYRDDSAQYFKVLNVLKLQAQWFGSGDYYFTLDLVKTTCTKEAGRRRKYKGIQECEQLPGNQEILSCYFVVVPSLPPFEFDLFPECIVEVIAP